MDKKRIEKEIKKVQKKGIYNPKLKLGIVGLILTIGTIIGTSYAYYTETASNALIINATISKKITVEVKATNGTVNSMSIATAQTDYGTSATFTVKPNEGYQYKEVTCKDTSNQDVTSKVTSSYNKSNNTLTLNPKTINDVTCTVTFGEETVKIFNHEYKVKQGDPDFSKGCPKSTNDSCSGLYKMEDYSNSSNLNYNNPGGTSYYFRGEAKNNYVKFANNTWRIVRINGDGSIRLVLDGDDESLREVAFNEIVDKPKYVGYTYDNNQPCTNSNPCKSIEIATNNEENIGTTNHGGTNSTIKKTLEAWYYDNLRDYDSYITYGIFCNDTSYGSGNEESDIVFAALQRKYHPSLKCPDPKAKDGTLSLNDIKNGNHTYGGVYKLKIGLLSFDELTIAGFNWNDTLINSNYLYHNSFYWSMSPLGWDGNTKKYLNIFFGHDIIDSIYSLSHFLPIINLNSNVTAMGNGTEQDPYVIIK